jgi:hypothetical protein
MRVAVSLIVGDRFPILGLIRPIFPALADNNELRASTK